MNQEANLGATQKWIHGTDSVEQVLRGSQVKTRFLPLNPLNGSHKRVARSLSSQLILSHEKQQSEAELQFNGANEEE